MTIAFGQQSALRDLEAIAREGDVLEIINLTEPEKEDGFLLVELSLSFEGVPRSSDGIPLRQRERFYVVLLSDYPFSHPHVFVPHERWAGWPHVQWKKHLCLYLAPDTEWSPSDGMFGFIERLYLWVKRAAVNQLDQTGAPLHPPVAYLSGSSGPLIVPYVNTPAVKNAPWLGFGHIRHRSDDRIDVVGWCGLDETPTSEAVAAGILLPQAASFEFPKQVRDLLNMLEGQGVSRSALIRTLGGAADINGKDTPLLVLIGTPTRGIRESGEYSQHLMAWLLEPVIANGLRLALEQFSPHERLQEIGLECERIVLGWSEKAEVNWCQVREARPEVTIRRDEESPLGWFRNKSVVVWGCGAIGGHVAEALARAGVSRLALWDKSTVTPGVLVRQPFDDSDIGKNKAVATRDRLLRMDPRLAIEATEGDLLRIPIDQAGWSDGVDIVINATASWPVAQYLETARQLDRTRNPVIAAMALGHRAQRALLYIVRGEYTGATANLARKTKIEALRKGRLWPFVQDFWPKEPPASFQPEPGCSEPTFIGSQAEVMGLVGSMLSKLATELASSDPSPASSHLLTSAGVDAGDGERREQDFFFDSDIDLTESVDGYSVRMAPQALADLRAWIRRSERLNGRLVETGGHLFGERNDAARVIWVSEVSGPPPDSKASPSGFVCGFEGVAESSEERSRFSRNSLKFIGMWHTHPNGSPKPSETDYRAMHDIVNDHSLSCPRSLLLVIGTSLQPDSFQAAGMLFSRGRVPPCGELIDHAEPKTVALPKKSGRPRDVGLALSGGGARAIAFHLGCMRALHDRSILDRVDVISSVSGGSVLAAMYAYTTDDFNQFDERVQEVLRKGIQGKIVRHLVLSPRMLQILGTWLVAGTLALGTSLIRFVALLFLGLARLGQSAPATLIRRMQAPLRRWVSRVHGLEAALFHNVIGGANMSSPRRDGVNVVINATELRTGSAFRFGSRESGTWRFGRIPDNNVSVAHAVAASAAYPMALPAFDEIMKLEKGGTTFQKRVLLTDGGIYDNLGTSCFESGRSAEYSYNVYNPKYIVSCDAGRGLFDDEPITYWWPSRVIRAAESVFRKAQDRVRSQLFESEATGAIEGFILSYLGTADNRLPAPPPDLIRRDEVSAYPTDFAPMRQDDIYRLTLRGEQVTRLLITRYLPEL